MPNGTLQQSSALRILWVISTLRAGGIGPVCKYAAEAMAQNTRHACTVLSLREPQCDVLDDISGVRFVAIDMASEAPENFLKWLVCNPHDIVITNDVAEIESCFAFFPPGIIHIIQMHDSGRRYLKVAVRHHRHVDAILCVAQNVEAKLRPLLRAVGFDGMVATVQNGASFPPVAQRDHSHREIRLLYMGNMDPLVKGIYDLVPILSELGRMQVPSHLIVAGGRNEILESRIRARGLANKVTFLGWVPHKDCYKLAAASDIFLMVSRRESFGMVTIEAMAMGCVPIANDIPSGSQEIIENKKSGFLLALGDARAWANTIRQLHEDRSRLLLLSQRAQERARYNFSSNRMADDLTVAIDQIFALAKTRVAQRTAGMPIYQGSRPYETTYHKVPPQIRLWLRNFVANFPYISWRLLSR